MFCISWICLEYHFTDKYQCTYVISHKRHMWTQDWSLNHICQTLWSCWHIWKRMYVCWLNDSMHVFTIFVEFMHNIFSDKIIISKFNFCFHFFISIINLSVWMINHFEKRQNNLATSIAIFVAFLLAPTY